MHNITFQGKYKSLLLLQMILVHVWDVLKPRKADEPPLTRGSSCFNLVVCSLARLMGQARTAILEDRYPEYLKAFFPRYFAKTKGGIPSWCVDALKSVGVDLEVDRP